MDGWFAVINSMVFYAPCAGVLCVSGALCVLSYPEFAIVQTITVDTRR
jgi:hypothetical protein